MKRILILILAMVFFFAAPISAEEEKRQIYINSDMNMILYIDQPTLQYANQGNVLVTDETIYQDSPNVEPGGFMTVFYVLGDVSVLANESASSYDEVVQVIKKYATPILAFTMTNDAQVQIPSELASMESQLLQDEGNVYRVHMIASADYDMLDETTRIITDTTLHGFADLSANVNITPPSSNQALGMFDVLDIYGNPFTAQIFAGYKLTMVNVWATYCSPCIEEMPYLAEIAGEYRDKNIQLVGIVSDVQEGSAENDETVVLAKEIAEKTGASGYTHLIPDSVMILNKLKDITAVPTTFFINENGEQVGEAYVGSRSKEEWIRIIEDTLTQVN